MMTKYNKFPSTDPEELPSVKVVHIGSNYAIFQCKVSLTSPFVEHVNTIFMNFYFMK